MARLTRHVQYAVRSPWSRICRWQAGITHRLAGLALGTFRNRSSSIPKLVFSPANGKRHDKHDGC